MKHQRKSKSKSKSKPSSGPKYPYFWVGQSTQNAMKKGSSPWALKLLSGLSWITALLLGILVLVGCISRNEAVHSLYLAEIRTNQTYDVQLFIGYFGACVSMTNITGGPGIGSNGTSDDSQIHCIPNMRDKELDHLGEAFWEGFTLTDAAQAQMKASLNKTLPLARHLQSDVFYWEYPLLHVVLFTISSIMLFVAATTSSSKRSYRLVLVLAALLSSIAVAFTFVATIGSRQALNSLVDGSESKKSQELSDHTFISRADRLYPVQLSQVVSVVVFYVAVGITFTR